MDYFFKSLKRGAPRFFFSFLFLLIIGVGGMSSLKAQSLSPGDIVISEFMANPDATNDGNGEYIELYNKRAIDINIDGFTLSDDGTNSHVIDNGSPLTIPAESFIVLARSSTPGFTPDYVYGSFTLANSEDEIILADATGQEIARLNYTGSAVSQGTSSELNDVSNVNSEGKTSESDYADSQSSIGNGDNGSPGMAGSTNTAEDPKVRFLTSESTVSEDSGSGAVTVLLQDPDGNQISVDVVFESGGSEANASDFTESSPVTVTFPAGASDGAQLTAYTPNDDSDFEGSEKAVFTLSNLSTSGAATIVSPNTSTVTVTDDDSPSVVINEIMYDPNGAGNPNGDDTSDDGTGDEFVELVNNSGSELDISNWTLSDGTGVQYTFPSGTVIPDGNVFVVFADPAEGTTFGGAYLFSAGSLSLNNGGDDVILRDSDGKTITSYTYSGSESEESITRDPDITGSFVGHSTADTDDNSNFSPGTKVDGTAFGSTYAIAFRGTEGWRFVSTPSINTSFSDLFADLWTQGVTGSNAPSGDPNLYSWQESGGGSFSNVGNMSNNLTAGQGYIIYVFEDDDYSAPGLQGGFPKVINTSNDENASQVNVAVSSNDEDGSGSIDGEEGYNLLGNPFGTDISVDAVITALESVNSNVNANVYIWDEDLAEGDGNYEILAEGSGETIAPFQAFFVRYTENGISGDVTFNRSDLAANRGTRFYKQSGSEPVNFELRLGNEHKFDTYEVVFDKRGTIGEDRFDAYKLFSLNADAIQLFSLVGEEIRLARNILPALEDLDSELRIPVGYDVSESGQYTFGWSELDDIPRRYELHLVDNETGRKINMRNTTDYSFNLTMQGKTPKGNKSKISPSIDRDISQANESRFELVIAGSAPVDDGDEEMDQMVTLSPNYPNPFRAGVETRMDMQLRENVHVKVTIWNIVGQKVATLRDEMMPAGDASLSWSAPANMPSGIYICKVEAGSKVITRKMTLVK